jgi:serine/threonine protein kinase/Tfp pilus assembly protein PilF
MQPALMYIARMPITPGSRLGPYEIVAAIGAGGMGEVYRARDPRLGREVAIKVLPEDVAQDADRLARFEREARTVAALNHPNIVVLHSIETDQGTRFLTMELVEGQTLDRQIMIGGLPLARVLDLAIPIADALVAAHGRGVVHRDLKPGNVMVTRDGRVKVLDFGLARPAADGGLHASQAATVANPISSLGDVVGTVPYMAPEQLRGEPVDSRADLFSFGIMLYELVTGRRPFGGATSAEVGSAILRDAPAPVQSLRPDLPSDLGRIIGRCLEKDPERRVQTAKDVRNELEIVRRESLSGPVPAAGSRAALRAAPAPAESPSVAVLPFANRSRDPDDEYFSDGLADELLSTLVKIRGLRVAARTSSATFKGKTFTIAEVGRTLNVATVLEGSVRKAGNRVRISVQLVKVEDGYPLWSETYDRTLDDIFAVQDDIAQAVVKELRTTLLGAVPDTDASGEARAEVAQAAKGRGVSAEAHRLYLQGKHLVGLYTLEGTARGIAYLREALALDPGHALAWVALAHGHAMQANYGWAPVVDGYREARAAVEQALALAPDLPDALVILSQIRRAHDWDWKGADQASRRALELAPQSVEALAEAGVIAHGLCRFDEAEALLRRAIEQDPLSSRSYSFLALVYRAMGRLAEAEAAYRKSLELSPQRITSHLMLTLIFADQGRHEEALAEANAEPAEWAQLTALAYAHHLAGRRSEADQSLGELETEHAVDSAYQIAALHAFRHETDAAFLWLDRGVAQRDAGMSQACSEPGFRYLHGDPRWAEFMRKVGIMEARTTRA